MTRLLITRILVAIAWVYAVAHFYSTGVRYALRLFASDFLAVFPTWQVARFVGRLDMYHGSLAEQWGPPPVWYYGPVLHLITLPLFAFETLRGAFTFWLVVNYVFVGATLLLLVLEIDDWRPTLATTSLVFIVALNFSPFYEALTIRAIEVFELLLLVVAFALHRGGRSTAAGLVIGVAAMAKFLPLIYIPYFALKRDWRALGASVATVGVIAVATQLTLGWRYNATVHQLTADHGGVIRFEENQSLAGFVLRIVDWTDAPVNGPLMGRIAIVLGLVALTLLFLRTVDRGREVVEVEWWMLITAAVLLPPHNQNYYAILLLPAYLVLFVRYRAAGLLRSPRAIALYASFLVVGLPMPLSAVSRVVGFAVWPVYLRSGGGFVGAAILVALLALELTRWRVLARLESVPNLRVGHT